MARAKLIWFGARASVQSAASSLWRAVAQVARAPLNWSLGFLRWARALRAKHLVAALAICAAWAGLSFMLLAQFSDAFDPVEVPASAMVSMERVNAFSDKIAPAGLAPRYVFGCSIPATDTASIVLSREQARRCLDDSTEATSWFQSAWFARNVDYSSEWSARRRWALSSARSATTDFEAALSNSKPTSFSQRLIWGAPTGFGSQGAQSSEASFAICQNVFFAFFIPLAMALLFWSVSRIDHSAQAQNSPVSPVFSAAEIKQMQIWGLAICACWLVGGLTCWVFGMFVEQPLAARVAPVALVEQTCERVPFGQAYACEKWWSGEFAKRASQGRLALTPEEAYDLAPLAAYSGPNSASQTARQALLVSWPMLSAMESPPSPIAKPAESDGLAPYEIDRESFKRWQGIDEYGQRSAFSLVKDEFVRDANLAPAQAMLTRMRRQDEERATQSLVSAWAKIPQPQAAPLWASLFHQEKDPALGSAQRQLRILPMLGHSFAIGWLGACFWIAILTAACGFVVFCLARLFGAGKQTLRALETRGGELAARSERRELGRVAGGPKSNTKKGGRL